MAQYAAERSAAAPAAVNPAPLGLSAFALTTFVLTSSYAGFFTGGTIVIGLALFYGGLAQILTGMWEFRGGNTFGAVAFTSYGSFWLAVGYTLQNKLVPNDAALGFFLLGWTIFTALMLIATLRTNIALIAVFGFLTLTFLALTIANLGGGSTWVTIGGYLGVITAICAWYTALAGVLASLPNPMFTLPTWPRS